MTKRNKALLRELVVTDFKLRYQGSTIGYAWSLLRPLLIFLILYVVFDRFLKLGKGVPHYPVYLLFGLVIWNFFADMTTQGMGSIVARGDILRKVSLPRWIIVVSATVSVMINFGFNLVVVALFMVIGQVSVSGPVLLLPFLFLEVYLLGLGLALFLAAAFVRYRDFRYVWEVAIQALFYLTPIIYPVTLIPNVTVQKVLLLNPLAQAIQDARYVTVTDTTSTIYSVWGNAAVGLVPVAITLVVLAAGTRYFRRAAGTFAEEL